MKMFCHFVECRYAECRYAECRYAECRYAECRGANAANVYIHPSLIFAPSLEVWSCIHNTSFLYNLQIDPLS